MQKATQDLELDAEDADLRTYCAVHPEVETTLRCNRCGRLMCTRCAVSTPVGYRCKECVRGQQDVYYTAGNTDYLIAGAVSFGLSLLASLVTPRLGLLFAFILGPVAGTVIARGVLAAVRRRRGRYTGLIVAGGIAAGALPALWPPLQWVLMGAPMEAVILTALGPVLFTALAAGTAYSWFRYGR